MKLPADLLRGRTTPPGWPLKNWGCAVTDSKAKKPSEGQRQQAKIDRNARTTRTRGYSTFFDGWTAGHRRTEQYQVACNVATQSIILILKLTIIS